MGFSLAAILNNEKTISQTKAQCNFIDNRGIQQKPPKKTKTNALRDFTSYRPITKTLR